MANNPIGDILRPGVKFGQMQQGKKKHLFAVQKLIFTTFLLSITKDAGFIELLTLIIIYFLL